MKFRQASNWCKRVLEADKLAYANKTRVYHFPETWFTQLLANSYLVFSTKVNLPYPVCLMTLRCCLLHPIKQNCLLKTFLRTLVRTPLGDCFCTKSFFFYCYQLRNFNFEPNFKLWWCLRFVMDLKFQWPQTGLNCEPLTLIIVT